MTGGLIVYGGYRRQRGAGILGSLRKYMAPMGRTALKGLRAVAKNKTVQSIAKKAAEKGAEVLTNVAVDALQGRNINEAFKERSREAALQTLTGAPAATSAPVANTSRKRKRARRSKSRKARKQARQFKQRKRLPSSQSIGVAAPAAKKRKRAALSRATLNRKDLF